MSSKGCELGTESSELVVVEGTTREGYSTQLLGQCIEENRVTMTKVQRRIRRQHVQVATTVDVRDPHVLGRRDDYGQWMVIVGAVLTLVGDVLLGIHT
jgi:hypothetical protein